MSTYTQVFYFSPDDELIEELDEVIEKITADVTSRAPFMHARAQVACQRRIELLRGAAAMLREPVPRSFGG